MAAQADLETARVLPLLMVFRTIPLPLGLLRLGDVDENWTHLKRFCRPLPHHSATTSKNGGRGWSCTNDGSMYRFYRPGRHLYWQPQLFHIGAIRENRTLIFWLEARDIIRYTIIAHGRNDWNRTNDLNLIRIAF